MSGAGRRGGGDGDVLELACCDRFEEGRLDVGALLHQPAHLDDDRGRDCFVGSGCGRYQ